MLDELCLEIEKKGASARSFAADVTDKEAVFAAAGNFRSEFGKIDILIANAGIAGGAVHAKDLQTENFAQVVNVNLLGAVNSVAAVLPQMVERNSGHLVAISSLAAYRGLPKSAAYCASKAAMTALFESLRVDLRGSGVFVTTVHPGFIKTPLTSGRENKMPFLMELPQATAKIVKIIEKKKKTAAFPFPLSTLVRAGQFFPAWLYDRIAGRSSFRE
jgi:NADP-dependent 3-hydroxy acid dehydrogenase YdfG